MRLAFIVAMLAPNAWAQFRATAPLVIVPVTVADSNGRYVDGLASEDFVLYDNGVPQTVQMNWAAYPIDLVVVVQASSTSGAMLDKLGGSGILLTQLLAADAGETALVSFSDDVKVHQDFTSNPDILAHGLRMLRKEGIDGRMLDALGQASSLLERRSPERRRIILMIAEKRDRSSRAKLSEVLGRLQRINAAVYWLTYSPLLEPFTVRPKTVEDLKPEAERIRVRQCMLCPPPDDTPVPADLGPGSPTYGIRELARLQQPDLSSLFTETLGGRLSSFLTKNALERAIHLVSDEVHAQYVLSFEPRGGESGTFHTIRVAVKNRPGVEIRARAGYWAL